MKTSMKQYKHLLGIYRIGEIDKLKSHAFQQLEQLNLSDLKQDVMRKANEPSFKRITPRIEIHLFLIDNDKE